MRRSTRVLASLGAVVALIALVTACGGDEDEAPSTSDALTVEISVEGDSVTPNGDVVEVEQGQEVRVEVKADTPGALHVHSDPEQEVEYDAGTTRASLGTFDTPGRYAVEIHALEVTVVTLEVS